MYYLVCLRRDPPLVDRSACGELADDRRDRLPPYEPVRPGTRGRSNAMGGEVPRQPVGQRFAIETPARRRSATHRAHPPRAPHQTPPPTTASATHRAHPPPAPRDTPPTDDRLGNTSGTPSTGTTPDAPTDDRLGNTSGTPSTGTTPDAPTDDRLGGHGGRPKSRGAPGRRCGPRRAVPTMSARNDPDAGAAVVRRRCRRGSRPRSAPAAG